MKETPKSISPERNKQVFYATLLELALALVLVY